MSEAMNLDSGETCDAYFESKFERALGEATQAQAFTTSVKLYFDAYEGENLEAKLKDKYDKVVGYVQQGSCRGQAKSFGRCGNRYPETE